MRETIPQFLRAGPVDNERQANLVRLACCGIVILLLAGIWLQVPYLTMEQSRLEPWKIVELWSIDVLALVWFIRFTITHAIAGEPLVALTVENGRGRLRTIALIGAAAIAIELGLTLHLMFDEQARYAKGIATEAQATAIRRIEREEETWYELKCTFKDQTGLAQTAYLRVEANHHVFPAGLAPETAKTLLAGGGGNIRIRYDPEFPARTWAEGAGWDNGDAIYWFCLLCLFFQSMVTALFLLLLRKVLQNNILPWWWDIYKVLPLAVAAFWLFVMGLIDKLMDSLN